MWKIPPEKKNGQNEGAAEERELEARAVSLGSGVGLRRQRSKEQERRDLSRAGGGSDVSAW